MAEKQLRLKRTHMCGVLSEKEIGETVVVSGWVQSRRDLGGIIFITLRDRTGYIQVVFNQNDHLDLFNQADKVRSEYVLAIEGVLRKRAEDNYNLDISTGTVEVFASDMQILSKAKTPPFEIEDHKEIGDQLRLKYRYLDLRRPSVQESLITRHKVAKIARDFYDENGFLEIETPMLIKSTPEGARDYLVPSRVHPGKFYALPQSPQQYKQILMLSGMDRYYQIVRCFRDEDLRADRQPEFTQIDLEMSFVDADDVISVNEKFLKKLFQEIVNVDLPDHFDRMTYQEAMDRYGSDKPDRRFGMELFDVSDIVKNSGFKVFADVVAKGGSVRAINAKNTASKLSRRDLDSLVDFVKIYRAKGMAWIVVEENELKSPITKFFTPEETDAILKKADAQPGDIIMFVADKDTVVYDALGNLRLELARRLDLIDKDKFDFLWVTEFPLLEYDEEEKRYVAKHHPFTSPMDEDLEMLTTAPEKVRAKAYDVVLNGCEIGGGSIRIHDSEIQRQMFRALGISDEEVQERFGFLIEAFQYGAPPHGGMAYGLDRLVMLLCKKESIRDVIAFPKVQNASELMSNAPASVDVKQLRELSIKVNLPEKK